MNQNKIQLQLNVLFDLLNGHTNVYLHFVIDVADILQYGMHLERKERIGHCQNTDGTTTPPVSNGVNISDLNLVTRDSRQYGRPAYETWCNLPFCEGTQQILTPPPPRTPPLTPMTCMTPQSPRGGCKGVVSMAVPQSSQNLLFLLHTLSDNTRLLGIS